MKRTKRELNEMLDQALNSIRQERLEDSAVKAATDRVWRQITAEKAAEAAGVAPVDHIRGCEDFQALIPSYLEGHLSPARSLLLEDHTHECIPCRKALKDARAARRGEVVRPSAIPGRSSRANSSLLGRPAVRWAIAATLVVGLGLFAWPWVQQFTRSVGTLHTIVQASNGNVFRVTENRTQAIAAGEKFRAGEHIRTAPGATASVKLPDGSTVEMRERSELFVRENGEGTTIHLERGQIIVEAAKQRDRHLFVKTEDSLVSVKGTIFSVIAGTKGSRVSVVEGEVHVNRAGERAVLRPGDQVATHTSITRVPVRQEVAWSSNADKYGRMLSEIEALKKSIDSQVSQPGARYSTRLLDLAPEGTVLYIALPNLTETLAQANRILEERIATNAELRAWWEEQSRNRGGFNSALTQIREFGAYLGPEIVLAASLGANNEPDEPVILAELANEAGFETYLRGKLAEIRPPAEGVRGERNASRLHLLTKGEEIPARSVKGKGNDFYISIGDGLVVASPDPGALSRVQAAVRTPEANRFKSSPFRAQLSELYQDGVGLLIAADLAAIFPQALKGAKQSGESAQERSFAEKLGFFNAKYFIAELKEKEGRPTNRAVLSFSKKSGMSAWLAEPGPMGALEFISPDATVVASFVVERPISLVDDLFGALQTADPGAWQQLQDFQTQHGINLRNDFAAPLGGEFAFALDGPVLPLPAWKAVIEVEDPARLQQSFEQTVALINQYAVAEGKQGFQLSSEESGNRVFHTLKSLDFGAEACYTFAYGYLIAAPTRTLVERALQYRESSVSILNAPRFKATLPEDRQANFSAMFYYNFTQVSGLARGVSRQMPSGPGAALGALASSKPMLAYVYAENGRFTFSANTEEGPIGLTPSMLLGLPGPFGLEKLMK